MTSRAQVRTSLCFLLLHPHHFVVSTTQIAVEHEQSLDVHESIKLKSAYFVTFQDVNDEGTVWFHRVTGLNVKNEYLPLIIGCLAGAAIILVLIVAYIIWRICVSSNSRKTYHQGNNPLEISFIVILIAFRIYRYFSEIIYRKYQYSDHSRQKFHQ